MKTLLKSISIIIALYFAACDSASFDKPHKHEGLVPPYKPKAPKVDLNKDALSTLNNGKIYKTQIMDGSSGRGLVVLDVHSPTATIWSRILDYNNYAKMVSGCTASRNYNVIHHKPSKSNQFLSQTIYTRMKIGISVVNLEYFIKHSYHPKLNVLTWTLDYSKTSDLDDSVGYWYVVEHPTKGAEWARVFYSVDVALPNWLPKYVKDFFSTKALTDATSWVKRESEKISESERSNGKNVVSNNKKKKKRCWWNPFRNKKAKKLEDESDVCNASSCDAADTEPKTNTITLKRSKRAFLIFLAFVLFLYNLGLFLERAYSK